MPVALAYPSYGRIGVVGTMDVDAQTGEPDVQPNLIAEIKRNGKTLTQGIP